MSKLISIILTIIGAYLIIRLLRGVFAITPGTAKLAHFGYSTFGFNVIELFVVLFFVFVIFGLLLKKD